MQKGRLNISKKLTKEGRLCAASFSVLRKWFAVVGVSVPIVEKFAGSHR